MVVLSDFTFTFTPEQQVAFDWFCKTYIKKMADSEFKIVIENMYSSWKDRLLQSQLPWNSFPDPIPQIFCKRYAR